MNYIKGFYKKIIILTAPKGLNIAFFPTSVFIQQLSKTKIYFAPI